VRTDRRAAVLLAGLVPLALTCVPALPGGPYDSPDDAGSGLAGPGGAGGASIGGHGASPSSTGAGGSSGGGGPGAPGCALPWPVSISAPSSGASPAGTFVPFQLTVTNPNDASCAPQIPKVSCSSPFPPLSFQMDASQWFAAPLSPGQSTSRLFSVGVPAGTPSGGYTFACTISQPLGPASWAMATLTIGGSGPPPVCLSTPPTTSAILDAGLMTPLYTYAAAGLRAPDVVPTSPASFSSYDVTVNPGVSADPSQAWVGFGFNFQNPSCVDASLFSGVRFTITGTLGTCSLNVSVVTSEDSLTPRNPFGACTMEPCYPPMSGPLSTGTSTVSFAEMTGGMPMATVDARALNGIQWTLNVPTDPTTPPCVASFTLSDVSFVAGL